MKRKLFIWEEILSRKETNLFPDNDWAPGKFLLPLLWREF